MIGEYMRRLQVLSLEYCRKVSDEGVLNMLHRSASLLHIDLLNTSLSEKTKKLIFEELGSRSLYGTILWLCVGLMTRAISIKFFIIVDKWKLINPSYN